jgi:hypothetical protein
MGCSEDGACDTRGGIDMRDASGAVVWGTKDTSGSHGTVLVSVRPIGEILRNAYIGVFLLVKNVAEDH